MLSSLTANGAQITTDALMEGAFDFIHKPGSRTDARRQPQVAAGLAHARKSRSFATAGTGRVRPRHIARQSHSSGRHFWRNQNRSLPQPRVAESADASGTIT